MKYATMIIICLIFSTSLLFAQETDSTDMKKKEEKQVTEQQQDGQKNQTEKKEQEKQKTQGSKEKELKGFVDVNANGIDDRLENSGKGKGKGQPRDRFVDNDGDGICDGKESAIGLRKLFRNRKGKHNR
jgi:hypothetical protein